ncbi:MAG: altronate hydrolase [Peptococcaceae bacterium BICA1-8]|nr:MAG: altronate hydrolase [Peptococcaceae bacterium BICA1-8]
MGNKEKFILINEEDSVVVATQELKKGEIINLLDKSIILTENIALGHKIAIKELKKGEEIIKYGYSFGLATQEIKLGNWVHSHNVMSIHGSNSYHYNPTFSSNLAKIEEKFFFNGYSRENDTAGIRNHVYIIPTVFCANGPSTKIAEIANSMFPKTENFDGFLPLCHPYGCSQTGKDLEYTQNILAGLANNPNAGSVLIVSLGCEVNSLDVFTPYLGEINPERIKFLTLQDCEDEFALGLELCGKLYTFTSKFHREHLPLSKLAIGVNCGGSDGLSGITANPLVGEVSNKVADQGGTILMTEVPEMFGAEQILMNRAEDELIFQKIVNLITDYKAYFTKYGEEANENPTQGNRAGGITTLEEKSLGCILKGGKAVVTDVLTYGERLEKTGFVLLSGPGNDLVGVTAQIAAGCNLMIFTTGRGTPAGFACPTLRISTNNELFNKKKHWNDFNAGVLLEGAQVNDLAQDLLNLIIKVANGEVRTKTEINNYFEIGILRDGVTL